MGAAEQLVQLPSNAHDLSRTISHQMVKFRLNGETVRVPAEALHLSTANYIRRHTQCKSVKLSCNEGGCGACAVELVSPGGGPVLAVNSCLLPVGALEGCHIITSEGLGNSRTGFNQVQERLAAFHGTQCGFCSPGITVATHAALMAAAHKQGLQDSSSSSSSMRSACNGLLNGSSTDSDQCRSQQAAAAAGSGVIQVTSAQLLGALDGNLCRCTGWRPIADCAKSFAGDVDIEDLGLNSLTPSQLTPLSLTDLTPTVLQHTPNQHPYQHPQQQQQQQQEAHFSRSLQLLQHGSILAPSSMEQLLQALAAAEAACLPALLLGGNTGAGLYKEQWGRLSSSVTVLIRGVQELQQLVVLQEGEMLSGGSGEVLGGAGDCGVKGDAGIGCFIGAGKIDSNGSSLNTKAALHQLGVGISSSSSNGGSPVLVAGAGVTITQLIETLQDMADALEQRNSNSTIPAAAASATSVSSSSSRSGKINQTAAAADSEQQHQDVCNLQYMLCHLKRIAGTLVRNAATLGGHLALARRSHLESDLVTLMTAAGAQVCVTTTDGSCHWMDLETFCTTGQQQQQQQQQQYEGDAKVLQLLDRQQAVITAVQLTLPVAAGSSSSNGGSNGGSISSSNGVGGSVKFWSHKLTTHRLCNEHAAVNASIWLSGPHLTDSTQHNNSSNNSINNTNTASTQGVTEAAGAGTAGSYSLRIAVGTYQQQSPQGVGDSNAAGMIGVHDSDSTAGQQGAAEQQLQQQQGVWQCRRAAALEAALLEALQQQQEQGCCGVLQVLDSLAELVQEDIQPGGRMAAYVRSVLPGLVLKGLAAVLPPHMLGQHAGSSGGNSGSNGNLSAALLHELRVTAAQELSDAVSGAAVYQSGRQDIPVDLTTAPPLYWPTERDGGQLQASGEAVYADDVPILPGALHAAYVTSTQPHATLLEVDWSQALTVPGVTGWVTPQDIPGGPSAKIIEAWAGPQQPLFAHTTVTFVGQALGLVLAASPEAAAEGARRVKVTYGPVAASSTGDSTVSSDSSSDSKMVPEQQQEQQEPGGSMATAESAAAAAAAASTGNEVGSGVGALTSLSAAVAAGSFHSLENAQGSDSAAAGDVSAALASSARVLSGQVKAGSQRHFYMEPQVAVVTPEEGGRLHVVSSCQGCDYVLYGVCRALKLRHNEVHVTSKRVGGGFGGKASASVFHAAAAAVAAHKFRRQVRLVVPSSVDVGLNAGRCPMVLDWKAGVDAQDRLQALSLHLTLMDGAFGGGGVEAVSMKAVADSVYHLPHMDFKLKLARTNMPPRSTVRGPGKVSMIILLEMVMQQLAAALGRDPDDFRRQHMLQLPQEALAAAATAVAAAAAQSADATKQLAVPHPKYLPRSGSNDSSSSNGGSSSSSGSNGFDPLRTPLGVMIQLHQYTLPYMMAAVEASSGYDSRRAAVAAFNAGHTTRKRGLALVPVRYPLYRSFYTGRVTIYSDGSVLLSHAGVEIGQGISSKVKQTAAATLGQLLPPEARAGLLPFIRVSGGSTELMAHAGLAAGSTTSEGATAAIAAACEELVGRLEGSAAALKEAGQEVTWEGVVKGVCGWEGLTTKVLLTASARGGFHDEQTDPAAGAYQSFGVGAAEVEVDCVTGERRLLRADIMFDAGKSVSPAIDMGQIEGAFMNGVGYVMSEEVVEDEVTGSNLTDSTWTYKPPGMAELPQVFNVSMLHDSPCHVPQRKQLSAKATGEPPLMMAAAVACALQDACHAAWRGYEQRQQQCGQRVGGPESWPVLELPATAANLLKALPPLL